MAQRALLVEPRSLIRLRHASFESADQKLRELDLQTPSLVKVPPESPGDDARAVIRSGHSNDRYWTKIK